MFLFFLLLFFIFGMISGTFVLGRLIWSFWLEMLLQMCIVLINFTYFFCIPVCIYGYTFFDFCMLFTLDMFNIQLVFFLNGFYIFILFMINLIFCFIVFYALYYMFFDTFLYRFFVVFWLFALCMNFFVLAFDFITAYCGWELLGLFSYFLISYFWFRFFALKFSFKAFFISKIGDVTFLITILLCVYANGYSCITYYLVAFFNVDFFFIIWSLFMLLICAFTKSTQFGLHIWLPDAMEGPIPVSALIHAATLVICGIVLVSFLFWCYDFWFCCFYPILYWSSLILVVMSVSVVFNFDVKRYVAFSTICQISFSMFCCLTVDIYVGALFFCYHMFYKAALFIIIGVWIHFFYGLQDVRCFFFFHFCGCILAKILVIFALFNSCSFWFLCGFYCKDFLLTYMFITSTTYFSEFLIVSVLFVFITIIYNYYLLFFFCFVFKCFCLNDCLFLLFDFECCLIYCFFCVYLCFIMLFFVIDFIYTFMFSSFCFFWMFSSNFYNFFDIAFFVVFIILCSAFLNYGSSIVFLFSNDCINFFWKVFTIFIFILLFFLFYCWYFICFYIYIILFVWNVVIYFRYNFKYCLFFCVILLFFI